MGRPKGSKNKPKTAPPKVKAKAKAKTKAPTRVSKPDAPDWLRKAMAVETPTKAKAGRRPNAVKEKFKAIAQKGRRHMTISKDKPLADPMDDPDFRAGPQSDLPGKPSLLPAEEQVKVPEEKRTKATKLMEEREEEPAPKFDEVQSGAEIPPENAEILIAGTLGGSGDHHAQARRILERFVQANWVISKGLDEGTGDTKPGDPVGGYRPGQLPWQKPDTKPIDPDKPQFPSKPGDELPSFGDKPGPGRSADDPKGADAGKGRSKDDPKGADDGKRSKA